MNYKVIEVTEIEEDVLSLAEAKVYLRVTSDHDDELITSLVNTSISYAESYTKENIKRRKYKILIDSKLKEVMLPSPILQIEEAVENGHDSPMVDDEDYLLNGSVFQIKKNITADINLSFISGYQTIPSSIKQAILAYTSLLYDRESLAGESLETIRTLLAPYKKYRIA